MIKRKNILYTILSVLALIVVIVGIVFAWQVWLNEGQNNNTVVNK